MEKIILWLIAGDTVTSKGEPGCDIDPNTAFQDLPEGFECPECYADKENFRPLDE